MARVARFPLNINSGLGRAAVIGSFDGVHRGHAKLIAAAVKAAKDEGIESAVITFHPHPSEVLGRTTRLPRITTFRQKVQILSGLGVDLVYAVRFTKDLSRLSAADFLDEVLVNRLGIKRLILGPDAAVGRGREGDVAFIKNHLGQKGIAVTVIDFLADHGDKVSSRKIRAAIQGGNLDLAASALGRAFEVEGHVRHGDKRGRTIGFPTANLILGRQISPPFGVYKTESTLRGKTFSSVTNVGVRPTFNGSQPTVETHLLNWQGGEFYKESLRVSFLRKIRDERRFSDINELKAQIAQDILEAQRT